MSDPLRQLLTIDAVPLLSALFASLACGLLGNFLVLRRLSMMGDAVSHSVLPGLVAAFLIVGTRNPLPMFIGAAAAGLVTVLLTELVKRFGKVEPGAAMGVVFSVMFALGVLLIERAGARGVDLDADCVLHGQLETLFWLFPTQGSTAEALASLPRQLPTLAITFLATAAFILICYKELRIASFDPGLAATQGISPGLINAAFMTMVAAATVASFEAVGSILVVAMLVCPASTARLLTDRLKPQLLVSAATAALSAVGGYALAAWAPQRLGLPGALNAAGMITVVSGALLAAALLFSPSHGVVARLIRRRRLAADILVEDILGALFRASESGATVTRATLEPILGGAPTTTRAIALATARAFITQSPTTIALTKAGEEEARRLIRRHRQWEDYLVTEAGLPPDHVHAPAERLEHAKTDKRTPISPDREITTDPHGRAVP